MWRRFWEMGLCLAGIFSDANSRWCEWWEWGKCMGGRGVNSGKTRSKQERDRVTGSVCNRVIRIFIDRIPMSTNFARDWRSPPGRQRPNVHVCNLIQESWKRESSLMSWNWDRYTCSLLAMYFGIRQWRHPFSYSLKPLLSFFLQNCKAMTSYSWHHDDEENDNFVMLKILQDSFRVIKGNQFVMWIFLRNFPTGMLRRKHIFLSVTQRWRNTHRDRASLLQARRMGLHQSFPPPP